MPTIANRGRYRYGLPADNREVTFDRSQSLRLRIRVAKQRAALTRALANGADPTALPELALRASQLTSRRSRKVLARTLRNVLGEARTPSRLRSRVVLVRRVARAALVALEHGDGDPHEFSLAQ